MIEISHHDTILRSFILFVQSAYAVLKYADAHLYRKAHLSVIKLVVLKSLAINNGVMTPTQIAEWTQTKRHNITTLVDRMKRDGLIRTRRNEKDRRIINVFITEKGQETLEQTMKIAAEIINQTMSSITEADAALLEKHLKVMRQNADLGLEKTEGRSKKRPA